jgi:hypothetical protein
MGRTVRREVSRMSKHVFALACVGALVAQLAVSPAGAQETTYQTTFVPLAQSVPGVLYQPRVASDRTAIGVLFMHAFDSYLTNIGCGELASRGYTVLCANPHTINHDDQTYTIEEQAPDIALGVKYLRSRPEIRSVVLMGHSAGGPMMSFYQNVALNGPSVCQGPEKLFACPDSLAGLPPGDGLILLDSHGGYGFTSLTYVDPSITEEQNPRSHDTTLDMYDPSNGFDANGATYTDSFRHRFLAAQGERSNRLIATAQDRWNRLRAGQGLLPDDEPFLVYGVRSRIWQPDLHLQSRTHDPHLILHPDGSTSTDIVHSVRVPSGSADGSKNYDAALVGVSLKQFLSSNALRTTSDYDITEDQLLGIDWASSSSSAPWNVEHIGSPLLIMSMTGHYFMVTDEIIYNHAASQDKQIAFVEGAVHGFTPCRACERTPGEFGDTVKTLFDHVDQWLSERF